MKEFVVLLVVFSIAASVEGRSLSRFLDEESDGTKWAVLVAGSNGWHNYRHQVAKRTGANLRYGSHVMQYGDTTIKGDALFHYMGVVSQDNTHASVNSKSFSQIVEQRETELFYLTSKHQDAPEGSTEKLQAHEKLVEAISKRNQVDYNVKHLGELLFGVDKGNEVLQSVRPAGQPLVDNWDCLKTYVKTFEAHCGRFTSYGKKHIRSIANICNAGIGSDQMTSATAQACANY